LIQLLILSEVFFTPLGHRRSISSRVPSALFAGSYARFRLIIPTSVHADFDNSVTSAFPSAIHVWPQQLRRIIFNLDWMPLCGFASRLSLLEHTYHTNRRAPPPQERIRPVWPELLRAGVIELWRCGSEAPSSSSSTAECRFIISAAASTFSSEPEAKMMTPPFRTPLT